MSVETGTPSRSGEVSAVLLIAHGSRHQPANDELRELARRIAGREGHAIVEPCFLELAEPDIPAGGGRCVERGAGVVLMVPYFLSAGVHLLRDLTAARDALGRRFPAVEFRLGLPLGPHPLLDALVAARIGELVRREVESISVSSQEMRDRYAPLDR